MGLDLPPPPPRVVETHISVLFFVGDRVYKLRKPVRTGFLDFTDRRERLADCRREVELNRRLAPDVYLGVLNVDRDGEVVDHLVEMRRLPAGRSLARLVGSGEDVGPCLGAVARTLARFHAGARRGPEIDREARAPALRDAWDANLSETAVFVGPVLDPAVDVLIGELAGAYLAGRGPLLEERIAGGRVCDGHGDLQAGDVFCLPDGPRILDCLEFSDRLRYADTAADLAFLVMDLDRLGAPAAAERLVEEYRDASGDEPPPSLLHFYRASRAYVRAKVACIRWEQGEAGAAAEAVRLHRAALRDLEAAQVPLVLVGGQPGSGKSTLARGMAAALGAVVLRSDDLRHDRDGGRDRDGSRDRDGGHDRPDGGGAPFEPYGRAAKDAVYRALLERAAGLLAQGRPVVADATWGRDAWREEARRTGSRVSSPVVELCCSVAPDVADRRIEQRLREGSDPSRATPAVRRELAATADLWPEAAVVDTAGAEADTLARALAVLSGRSALPSGGARA